MTGLYLVSFTIAEASEIEIVDQTTVVIVGTRIAKRSNITLRLGNATHFCCEFLQSA